MTTAADPRDRAARLAGRIDALCDWRQVAIGEEQTRLGGDVRAAFEALENGDLTDGPQAVLTDRSLRALEKQVDALAARRAAGTSCHADRQRVRQAIAEFIERALTRGCARRE